MTLLGGVAGGSGKTCYCTESAGSEDLAARARGEDEVDKNSVARRSVT
jgi:hypothetical protein